MGTMFPERIISMHVGGHRNHWSAINLLITVCCISQCKLNIIKQIVVTGSMLWHGIECLINQIRYVGVNQEF